MFNRPKGHKKKKVMKTYSEILNLGYKVSNPQLSRLVSRYGILEAVRELRMTLLSGMLTDIVYWQRVLSDSEDGAIVMEVWNWLFGTIPSIFTARNKYGIVVDAWVQES